MKRNNQFDRSQAFDNQELIKRIAYHEAGHAAAIYLCNKQKKLPPVHFQITINKRDDSLDNPFETRPMSKEHIVAAVEGGRLIHNLPITLIESANYFSVDEQDTYQTAFEADMINLLVGPIAEAKYVSICDNESFGKHLITPDSLHYYGGASDLERVKEYLESFIPAKERHEDKINELFNKAFAFIDSHKSWRAISNLANHILSNHKNIVTCEEAIYILEQNQTSPFDMNFIKADPIEKYVIQFSG
ncbi:MAG: hypothetical protein ABL925_06510 [Methylococcales bacterium]